jgi:2-oxoglutarate ferredoxin oxidoreductase subunit gamma
MNGPSLEKFEPMLKPGGHLFINSSAVQIAPTRTDVEVHYVDTRKIAAEEIGNEKTANMVMLGAMLRTCDIVNIETIDKTLEYVLKGGKAKLIPANKAAIMAWKED